jgi:peptidoglycan/xylan/chitin deacetylase (PgdA/CDA1 family)
MDRRTFISSAVGLGATALLCGCARLSPSDLAATALPQASLGPLPVTAPGPQVIPFDASRIIRQGVPRGSIYGLPAGSKDIVAWTVDDGFNTDVTISYAEFVRDSGIRMSFFVCGKASSWAQVAPILRPLAESGQVQMANHTHMHSNLLNLTDGQIQDDLMTNDGIIRSLFGVDAKPYFRPPFGFYDDRVAAAAAAVGYTVPVLWNGTLSDAGLIPPETLMQFADRYMKSDNIVLGHANYWPVATLFPSLLRILEDRNLMAVTLNDVYGA